MSKCFRWLELLRASNTCYVVQQMIHYHSTFQQTQFALHEQTRYLWSWTLLVAKDGLMVSYSAEKIFLKLGYNL